jgi:hypothetical protein
MMHAMGRFLTSRVTSLSAKFHFYRPQILTHHFLGIEHEHQRPDRDKFIKVKFENVEGNMKSEYLLEILKCMQKFGVFVLLCRLQLTKFTQKLPRPPGNFDKIPYKSVDLHGLSYDFDTVMHYDGQAFGKTDFSGRKMDTMVPLKVKISNSESCNNGIF